jgi:hypothetical protein
MFKLTTETRAPTGSMIKIRQFSIAVPLVLAFSFVSARTAEAHVEGFEAGIAAGAYESLDGGIWAGYVERPDISIAAAGVENDETGANLAMVPTLDPSGLSVAVETMGGGELTNVLETAPVAAVSAAWEPLDGASPACHVEDGSGAPMAGFVASPIETGRALSRYFVKWILGK